MRQFRLLAALVVVLFLFPAPAPAAGKVSVKGYTRKDGTYVQPHTRSAPRTSARTDARTVAPVYYAPVAVSPPPAAQRPTFTPPVTHAIPVQSPRAESPSQPAPEDLDAKAEQDAARKLKLAKQFVGVNGEVAQRRFREVIADHPDTKAAEEAKRLLK